MTTFAAHWPIEDDTATLRELITEATPDLHRLVTEAGHVIAGKPHWGTADSNGLSLLVAVDVEPIEQPPGSRMDAILEDVEFLLDVDPAATPEHVASRLGVRVSTLYRALAPDRGNRPDLRARLSANGRELGSIRAAEAMQKRRVA